MAPEKKASRKLPRNANTSAANAATPAAGAH
jgi:hypothetical protein